MTKFKETGIYIYFENLKKLKKINSISLFESLYLIKYFSKWKKYLKICSSPLEEELPWINFKIIDFLKKNLRKEFNVFEFGSGGSTIFLSRIVNKVFSVEHDEDWFNKVLLTKEKKKINNCEIILKKPFYDTKEKEYISDNINFKNFSFKEYVSYIDNFPDDYFDFIIIDGRCRGYCFLHSLKKIKTNGIILLDNSDRENYVKFMNLAGDNFYREDFWGPVPFLRDFTKATIWKKK